MKTQILKIMIAAGTLAGLAAAGVAAEGEAKKSGAAKGDRGAFFDRLDANGDGKVSEVEAPPEVWEKLSKLDKNGDGAVAKSELPQGPAVGGGGGASKIVEFLKQMDADGNGKISEAEAGERWARLGKLDKNKDGAIDLATELPEIPTGPGAGAGKGALFAKADKNGDKKLTEDELPEQAWERLSKLDKNGDGAVDENELAAVRQAIEAKSGQKPRGNNGGKKPKRPEADNS
ncbi:MAG: Ca2+-binding EF-hand superfamily protein [Verrucomicrobiales bacterium]|jgi:Ca2+-binding EF-hand superfamily protein